jgi:hypothetical protein
MKKWTPRRREFKFPVLTVPEHPSLASKRLVTGPYQVQCKFVYITETHVLKDYSNACTLSKIP